MKVVIYLLKMKQDKQFYFSLKVKKDPFQAKSWFLTSTFFDSSESGDLSPFILAYCFHARHRLTMLA